MSARSPLDLTQAIRIGGRRSAEQRHREFAGPATGEPSTESSSGRARRPIARLVSAVLEPVWYWLDLLGPDDHPSNAKVLATASIAIGLVILVVLAGGMAAKGVNPDEWFVVLALGLIGGAAGWDLMKSRGKTRAAIDALRTGIVPAEPAVPPTPEPQA